MRSTFIWSAWQTAPRPAAVAVLPARVVPVAAKVGRRPRYDHGVAGAGLDGLVAPWAHVPPLCFVRLDAADLDVLVGGFGRRLLLDELDQRAEGRLGMQEGDGGAAAAGARVLVDDAGSLGLDVLEHLVAVVDAVADVVDALAVLLHVLGQRRVVAERCQQLDVGVGHLDEGLVDAVALDALAVGDGGPEHLLVPLDDRIEVTDGDAHVVELGELAAAVTVAIAHQMRPLTESGMSSAMRMMGMPVWVFWCIS